MNHLIVARYFEGLDWISDVPDDFEVFVYNNGDSLDESRLGGRIKSVIAVPYAGRESETYLRHLVNFPEFPDDFFVFAQGNPREHSPDFLAALTAWRDWKPIQGLSWRWTEAANIPPFEILARAANEHPSRLRLRVESFSLMTWCPLAFFDQGAYRVEYLYRNEYHLPAGSNLAAHFLSLCGLSEIATLAQNHSIGVFAYGGIFAVRSDLVRSIDTSVLTQMWELSTRAAIHGYMFERLWLHIFGEAFAGGVPSYEASVG